MSSPFKPTRWIAIVAVLAVIAGIAVGYWHSRPPARPSIARAPSVDPDDGVIEQALGQIPGLVDSAAIRSEWQDEVRGAQIDDLEPRQREIFLRLANTQRCTCGCGFTLAACREYDLTCPVSLPRVEALLDSVRSGRIRDALGMREASRGLLRRE